ncbi:MAG: 30S ribosome-binding factor RbfA [Deltaproteobacteria bacterium]|nr:30S ribosome-binding factor RbfA [Deltaproteobacteria bacterium]
MQYKRSDRVGDLIREVLSEMLLRDLHDPRLESVTITGVEVTSDLKLATIFFSARGIPQKAEASLQGFQSATGFIKKKMAKELRLRYIPDFLFEVDHSFEYGSKIDRLIKSIHQEKEGDSQEDR